MDHPDRTRGFTGFGQREKSESQLPPGVWLRELGQAVSARPGNSCERGK